MEDFITTTCEFKFSAHTPVETGAQTRKNVFMPIREADPWRLQYFADAVCPANVEIPTEDCDAWLWNPRHRWVYDKIAVAQSQDLDTGPHGTTPPRFPMFSKPIMNLRGMGVGSRVLRDAADYAFHSTPGHMWMTLLEGAHVSTDVAVVDGAPRWWRHVTGKPSGEGTFDHWTVHGIVTLLGIYRRIRVAVRAMLGLFVLPHG